VPVVAYLIVVGWWMVAGAAQATERLLSPDSDYQLSAVGVRMGTLNNTILLERKIQCTMKKKYVRYINHNMLTLIHNQLYRPPTAV
jgi:isocitrate lyase